MSKAEPAATATQTASVVPRLDHARPETRFSGIPVSAGVAIGPVFGASEPTPKITRHKIQAADIAAEGARLEAAIAQSRKQLNKLRARLAVLPEESQVEIAPLIDAYIRMLGSSRLIRGVRQRIEETLVSAETAVAERPKRSPKRSWRRLNRTCRLRTAPASAPRRRGARDRPAAGAQPDPSAVPQLCRPARRRGTGQRVARARRTPRCSIRRGSPASRPRRAAPRAIPR